MNFSRYVALGDSFTEGVGDPDPYLPNEVRGWADRFAAEMARSNPEFTYANLAIRGRKLRPILAEQLAPALVMKPDLVSIYAGANDVLRPSVDIDSLMDDLEAGIAMIRGAGAHVVMFTAFDPGYSKIFGMMRGRFAIYSEYVREIAEKYETSLVDFWRMREYRDSRMWDQDRMHMSAAGHQRMAMAVLDTLGIDHKLERLELAELPQLTAAEIRKANFNWASAYAGPWVKRRLTGVSSGDNLSPRWPSLERPDFTLTQDLGGFPPHGSKTEGKTAQIG